MNIGHEMGNTQEYKRRLHLNNTFLYRFHICIADRPTTKDLPFFLKNKIPPDSSIHCSDQEL